MPKPLRARYSKIEIIVDNILRDANIAGPAVPVDRLVRKANIHLQDADLGDVSGLLFRSSERLLIGYNCKQARTRQRFTIAHEYGHFILHTKIVNHFDRGFIPKFRSSVSSDATDIEEIEANFFAATLLMPKIFLIKDHAMNIMDSDIEVQKLAKKYDVSRHAMSLRLANVFGDHLLF